METAVLDQKPQEPTALGEQRLYERMRGTREFRVAMYDGVTLPNVNDFRTLEGYDYSRDGFSFWSAKKPATESVVIELQYRNRANYHEARIMHLTQAKREGITWHLVGCRFTKRVEIASRVTTAENASAVQAS